MGHKRQEGAEVHLAGLRKAFLALEGGNGVLGPSPVVAVNDVEQVALL